MLYGWITTKMNGWELPIFKLVKDIRNKEMTTQKKANNIKCVLIGVISVSSNAIIMGIFLPAFYEYGSVELAQVFVVIGFMLAMGYVHVYKYANVVCTDNI